MQQVMKLMKSEGIHLACNPNHSRSVDRNSDAMFLLVIEAVSFCKAKDTGGERDCVWTIKESREEGRSIESISFYTKKEKL